MSLFFMLNIKNLVFGIAILILTMFVAIYGINTFYPSPDYNDFCSDARVPALEKGGDLVCPAVCVPMYEIKEVQCVTEPCDPVCELNSCGSGCGPDGLNSFDTLEQCEIAVSGKNCYDLYDDAREVYSRKVFMLAIPIGILIIAAGAYLFSLEAVGAGLMAGGAGTLVYGAGGYWEYADNWLKFVLSLVGLVALIGFAYWFNQEKKSFWKNLFFTKKRNR